MGTRPTQFEAFIRRVHRRYLLLRLLERAGLGVLVGCVVVLPLLAIVLWRGLPAMPLASAALITGGLAGLLWGWITRPTALAAAMEADRQLSLHDLLGSAITSAAQSQDDPWAAAVIIAANERCRGVSPASVVLNRLGARSWGGIGLAAALIVALGLLPTLTTSTEASGRTDLDQNPLSGLEHAPPPGTVRSRTFARRTPNQQDPDEANGTQVRGQEQVPPDHTGNPVSSAEPQHPHDDLSAVGNGHGAGSSQSTPPASDPLHLTQSATHQQGSAGARTASGGAGQSTDSAGNTPAGSGRTASSNRNPSQPVPPWQSSDWAADSKQALHAVEIGQVPDSYRDLVRGYFERP